MDFCDRNIVQRLSHGESQNHLLVNSSLWSPFSTTELTVTHSICLSRRRSQKTLSQFPSHCCLRSLTLCHKVHLSKYCDQRPCSVTAELQGVRQPGSLCAPVKSIPPSPSTEQLSPLPSHYLESSQKFPLLGNRVFSPGSHWQPKKQHSLRKA